MRAPANELAKLARDAAHLGVVVLPYVVDGEQRLRLTARCVTLADLATARDARAWLRIPCGEVRDA